MAAQRPFAVDVAGGADGACNTRQRDFLAPQRVLTVSKGVQGLLTFF
jgi:hypothetical protein